mgnify:CR=1 FL=1
MFEVRKTETFAHWLDGLRDIHARARVQVRVERLSTGNAGDVRPVGEGVSEMELIMALATVCISRSADVRWCFC